jgi:hypothetical protein
MSMQTERGGEEIAPIYPQPGSRRRWVGLRADLDGTNKFPPTRIRYPDYPARKDYAIPTANDVVCC